jgi:hypothetical protein
MFISAKFNLLAYLMQVKGKRINITLYTYAKDLQLRLEVDEGPEFGVDAGYPLGPAEADVARLLVRPINEAFGIPKIIHKDLKHNFSVSHIPLPNNLSTQ